MQTYWKCRGAREKGFYLEIGKLLTQEPGAQSTPCLLYWRSYHCPCRTPSEGLRTGVPGVLSCLSRPPATPASCECLTLTKLLGMRLLREAGKCLLAPKVHNRVEKGSVELRDKGFLKRWGNSGNSVRLYFGGSKITADGDCSREIKRRLLLGRKVMANLDSILKSRDTTLSTKVHLVKVMVFPVVMYGCESWTIKKAEC